MIVDYFVLTMTMRGYCDVWRGLVWSAFFHAVFLLIIPGMSKARLFILDYGINLLREV